MNAIQQFQERLEALDPSLEFWESDPSTSQKDDVRFLNIKSRRGEFRNIVVSWSPWGNLFSGAYWGVSRLPVASDSGPGHDTFFKSFDEAYDAVVGLLGGLAFASEIPPMSDTSPRVIALKEGVAEFLIEWAASGDDLRDYTEWDVARLEMLKDSVGIATHIGCPGGFCRLTLAGHWIAELVSP